MNADLLLAWMSETGSGSVRDLRQRIAWAARAADYSPKQHETGRWLRDISTLGHAEVDWDLGRWAATPSSAAVLPASGGTAVLAGSRRVGLAERLEELVSVHAMSPPVSDDAPLAVPTALFVQADGLAELRTSLEAAGVRYAGCSARSIAKKLQPIQPGASAAPPARTDAVEQLLPGSARPKFAHGLPKGDGLCRISVHGRPSYLYRWNGAWHHTDHATGILLDRANRGVDVIRFRAERTTAHGRVGVLFVDQGTPLPPLQARSLVLCSGLPTQFGNSAATAIYRNVPEDIALLVADSIHQKLHVIT